MHSTKSSQAVTICRKANETTRLDWLMDKQPSFAGSSPEATAYTELNNSSEEESRSSKRLIVDLSETWAIGFKISREWIVALQDGRFRQEQSCKNESACAQKIDI
jgi:hypothetical protein